MTLPTGLRSTSLKLIKRISLSRIPVKSRFRPQVEALEDRRLPATTGGILVPAFCQDLLHRPPDASAQVFADQIDEGVAPATVALEIETSPGMEFRVAVVADDYRRLLHRDGSYAELLGWASQLAAGATQQGVAAALIGSNEYYILHGGTAAGFLNGLYVDALSRPDSEGAWLGPVLQGALRSTVAYNVLNSPEGLLKDVSADYERYLGRSAAGDPGAAGLANALAHGASEEAVVATLLGSDEYLARQQEVAAWWTWAVAAPGGENVLIPAFYQDLLNRVPDSGGADSFDGQLNQGAAPAAVAYEIETAPGNEFRVAVVADDYRRFLHRDGSYAELLGWASQLAAGATQQGVAAALIGSNEYYVLHGGTAAGFLNGLYVDVLSRSDAEGAWLGPLSQGALRSTVAYDVLTSPEGSLRLVWADYERYLGRGTAGDPGANGYAALLQSGVPNERIVAAILGSTEYNTRQQLRGLWFVLQMGDSNGTTDVQPSDGGSDTSSPSPDTSADNGTVPPTDSVNTGTPDPGWSPDPWSTSTSDPGWSPDPWSTSTSDPGWSPDPSSTSSSDPGWSIDPSA
jgi:hypothetical protein